MRFILVLLFLLLSSCSDRGFEDPSREFGPEVPEDAPRNATHIHTPATLGGADTRFVDVNGTPIGVGCNTCHGPNPAQAWVASPGGPETFHEEVELEHGDMNCNHCHEATDRTKLHLADDTLLDLTNAMTLCAQCDGVQFRDFTHGSHGGMNGYWDTRRGPRDRNHCVDCHSPHSPAYELVMPVHPPRDRYLDTNEHREEAH